MIFFAMFPAQNDNFNAAFGSENGFSLGGGAGTPPSSDDMFESFFDGTGENIETEFLGEGAPVAKKDSHEFLNVGLHFFKRIKELE